MMSIAKWVVFSEQVPGVGQPGFNPFRVAGTPGGLSQGSAWRATLGYRMESLWDSRR
jgi:hypothetical protein